MENEDAYKSMFPEYVDGTKRKRFAARAADSKVKYNTMTFNE